MDYSTNRHYTNKNGKQLRDYMLEKYPERWEEACMWSAVKYYIRAGKKEGESKEKDLKKCEDYLNELNAIDHILYNFEEMHEDLKKIKTDFEKWEG